MAKVAVTVKYAASADEVWDLIGGFLTIDTWVPAVAKCTTQLEGRRIVRRLDLADGGYVVEPLLTYDDAERTYSYAITDGVMPVENYVAQIRVLEDDNGASCIVQWTASFDPTEDEESVVNLIANDVFLAALNGIKDRFGG